MGELTLRTPLSVDLRASVPRRARVIIAEDHPVVRDGLIDLLAEEPGIELIGCADRAAQVEELVRRGAADIVVLDLTLGADDGIALAQRLLAVRSSLKIIVLSMHDELLFADTLLSMGVMAYVTKDRTQDEFLLALRSVLNGVMYVTDEQRMRLDLRLARPASSSPEDLLSARELEVLRLLASGRTSTAIARELSVAIKTVYSYRRNIGSKLGIRTGREVVRYAVHWARLAG